MSEWQEQREFCGELKEKPSDLKRYEEELKQATFNYNRAEGYSSKGKHSTTKKFYNKSESRFEDAIEILQDDIQVMYDRNSKVIMSTELSQQTCGIQKIF